METQTTKTGLSELDGFYSDVIITAVEGGIGYWAKCSKYRTGMGPDLDQVAPASVTVHEREDEDCCGEVKDGIPVTTRDIAKAMRKIAGKEPIEHCNSEWRKRMTAALRAKDASDIDSGDADCIVQIAVLGEIRYG